MITISGPTVDSNEQGTTWSIFTYEFSGAHTPWSPINYTFDFLGEGEYYKLSWEMKFGPGVALPETETRELHIYVRGSNDAPVVDYNIFPGDKEYSIWNITGVQNSTDIRLNQDGSVLVPIHDLDVNEGALACEIVSVSNLKFGENEDGEGGNPHIANYPEWPGLQRLKQAMTCEFSPNKDPARGRYNTGASLWVIFNDTREQEYIDFSFLGQGETFTFDALVRVTDPNGGSTELTVGVQFFGWCDGTDITYRNYDGENAIVDSNYRIINDSVEDTPHSITLGRYGNPGNYAENAYAMLHVNIDDNSAPGADIYGFYQIHIEAVDRTNPKIYIGVGRTIGSELKMLRDNYGWTDMPEWGFAYNLSGDDIYNPDKYTTYLHPTINDVALDIPGEYVAILNVMMKVPASALDKQWPSSFVLFGDVAEISGLSSLTRSTSPGDGLSGSCSGLISLIMYVNAVRNLPPPPPPGS
jgi:hypothetical protein